MKISKLKTLAIPALNDILPILDINGGISGKPILRKATLESLLALIQSGETNENSSGFVVPTVVKLVAASGDYFIGIDDTGTPYKITKSNLLAALSSGSTEGTKLTGTPFGLLPTYSSEFTPAKAFDDLLTTGYNYISTSGGYVGLDLGARNTKKLSKVRIYPRQDGNHTRSSSAKIQGSNTSESSGYVDLFTFGSTPAPDIWYESGLLNISTSYRYLRYVGAFGTYSDITEIEFYGI